MSLIQDETKEKECSLYNVNSDDYLKCLRKANYRYFYNTPKYSINIKLAIILVLFLLNYLRVITIPIIGEMLPREK